MPYVVSRLLVSGSNATLRPKRLSSPSGTRHVHHRVAQARGARAAEVVAAGAGDHEDGGDREGPGKNKQGAEPEGPLRAR